MNDDLKKLNEIFERADSKKEEIPEESGTGAGFEEFNIFEDEIFGDKQDSDPDAKENLEKTTAIRDIPKKLDEMLFKDKDDKPEKKDENVKRKKPAEEEAPKDERDYQPVRQSREYRSGCLGGLLYFGFVACISIVLAVLAWMAASDVLALGNDDFTATISIPTSVISSETVDKYEDGVLKGTEDISVANIDYVADTLKDAGLIEYKSLFKFYCKISHAANKIDPGLYELKSTYDYRALIKNMQKGAGGTLTIDITIPEGYTMYKIFKTLEEEDVASYADLMEAAANYSFNYDFLDPDKLGDAARLEGYLFPDTYQFYIGMQASSAINKFLENYNYRVTDDMESRAESMGYSMDEIINIASMIEKEAANNDERQLIASVIYNRIRTGMTLGIDATILYVHPDHEGEPDADMLEEDSPYNTRIYSGLPPTPIANPGLASINAALYPSDTNYLYYRLDEESGTHRFFQTYEQFLAFSGTQG